ncbi:diguanylate cyclase [Methylomonas sp. AM2-LC]|uniref:sensor domain-containing diguanylate cyclase n=1 Tax=Methylomonas sp. AM2-LC TaxID=3153301 RepID=UPI003264D8BE
MSDENKTFEDPAYTESAAVDLALLPLLEQMLNGVAYCRMLYKEEQPIDFIYVYTNPAFEQLTGLKKVTGKRVSEVIPTIRQSDPELFKIYGCVAAGGAPVKFETYLHALGMWFSLSVYSPKHEYFVAIFDVTTERKLTLEKLKRSEETYRTLFETVAHGVVYQNKNGHIISANPAAEHILGLSLDQMQGRTSMDPRWGAIHEDGTPYLGELHPTMIAIKTGKPVYDVVMGIKQPKLEQPVWIKVYATPILKKGTEEVDYAYSTFEDITDRKRNEEAIRENSLRLKTILDNLFTYVALLDSNGVVEEINKATLERTGYRREEIIGQYFCDAPLWNYNDEVRSQLIAAINAAKLGKSSRYDVVVKLNDELVPIDFQISPVLDNSGQIIGLLPTAVDITERKFLEEELKRQAHLDYLTELPNRRRFMEQCKVELSRSQRYDLTLSILMLDIDKFKSINDIYGHQAGDLVLKKLALIFQKVLRNIDIAGRMGGEEFAIILPETDIEEALLIAERLREIICATEVCLANGLNIDFTVSIGIATLVDNNTNIEILVNEADKALYRAKQAGRNKVCT